MLFSKPCCYYFLVKKSSVDEFFEEKLDVAQFRVFDSK